MCEMKRNICLILIVVFLPVLFLSCGKSGGNEFGEIFNYASFRDVPGVTKDEIRAIELLQEQDSSFVYGVILGVESFYADGKIGGFSALFCEWLTGLFEIPFVPALYEWADLLAGLNSGEIDFTGYLTPTEERRKVFFMTDPIAQRTLKYFRIRDSQSITEIADRRPLRLIFLEGSTTYDKVLSLNIYGGFEPLFVKDDSFVYELLKSGKADAFIEENDAEAAFDIYGDMVAEDFFPMIYSPVSLATQNPALKPVISVVQKALYNGCPRYLSQLYYQGYQEYLKNKLFMRLSEEEKIFIQTHPVILFVAENDNYPVSFYNSREKQWQGIAFDVLHEIEALTGLVFELANDEYTHWPSVLKMLEDGEASMITELIQSEERKGRFLWPDSSIMTGYSALLSKSEFRDINVGEILYVRVGLHKGTAHTELFKSLFPDHNNMIEYENLNDAFDAMNRGEVDVVVTSQHQFLTLTNFLELPGYKINITFDRAFASTFGFNKNEEILCSIIDKALALTNANGIAERWMRKTFDYRLKLVQAQIPWLIGATALGFGLLFVLFLFFKNRQEGRKLERMVQERTAEMNRYHHDLTVALEAAKAANQSKSAFLANMSHEIRTPMNSIMGFTELAMDGETSPKTRDYLGKIKMNTEWLLQIINDILDISKIESGKMELEKIPFDLHELFAGCRTIIMPKANEKGIVLHFFAEPSVGKKPLGDPTRLRQVFINILSNSVKFTNSGMIKFLAEIVDASEKTITMHFEIIDSGIGMTKEQIDRIFDPFTQAETGTTRKYGGTGLGLSITKNIIEMMGGKLLVESAPGLGSKFSFNLVFDTIDIPDEELYSKKSELNEIEKPVFEGEVLLCEDNVMNQQVICEHLSRVGLKTVVADNGKKGVDLVRERKEKGEKQFDLILMDMHMPVMDGLEAAEKIFELNTGVHIVAMTANIMSENRDAYKKTGMHDCVGKPFTSQELWRCLLKFLTPVNSGGETGNNTDNMPETEQEFRKSLERMFVQSNQKKYEEITEALDKGDINLAYRMAHSLKSNAGQIGKTRLQQASAAIELRLKDGKNMVFPQQLEELRVELNAVLAEYAPPQTDGDSASAENSQTEDKAGQWLDAEGSRELINKLELMLRMGSPECLKYANSIRLLPVNEDLIKQLIQQMDNFDFEQARVTLAEMKEKTEMT